MSTLSTDHVKVEIAFSTGALDPLPDWVDVSAYVMSLDTDMGRVPGDDWSFPGTATLRLLNDDHRFSRDNAAGPYYGNIRRNRKVRISLRAAAADPWVQVHTGYVDSWNRSFPGGWAHSVVDVTTTDRFKFLARRTNTSPSPTLQEQAHLRIKAILDNADPSGPTCIIPITEYDLNPDGYACRTMSPYQYPTTETLDNLRGCVIADGGFLWIRGDGVLEYQSTRYRTDNVRATTSQETFGNTTGAVPVVVDSLVEADDDKDLANKVTITASDGVDYSAEDATSIAADGLVELFLGASLLRPLDAPDRVADALALHKNPGPRYDELAIDAYAYADARAAALELGLSDRITLAIIPPLQSQGESRPYFIERIRHDVAPDRWRCTYGITSAGAATTIYP